MQRSHLFFIIVFCSIAFTSCFRQAAPPHKPFEPPVFVAGVTDTLPAGNDAGVWYMLPKSRFEINVYLKRTELVKGPFSSFAGKYLGIDNVINSNTTAWQIEDIDVRATPVPDPDHLYFLAFSSGDSVPVPLELQININNIGVLSGATPTEDTRTFDATTISVSGFNYSSVFKFNAESNLFETIDTVIEKVQLDSVTVEKTVLKKKMVEKPMEQRAKEAADLIMKLRDQRLSLLTGYQEIPYDPATIKYMAGELEKMENEYIELFTGITIQTSHKRSFNYIPAPADDCIPVAMMRFSPQEGLLPAENKKGELMYVQFCSQGVRESRLKFQTQHIKDSLMTEKNFNTGFVYRNPEWAMVSVYLGNKVQKEAGFQIPQLGTVERLPWFITRFVIDPETGALISINTR